jgi:photosystem II stability/assembly factor-like uncharacterized protein
MLDNNGATVFYVYGDSAAMKQVIVDGPLGADSITAGTSGKYISDIKKIGKKVKFYVDGVGYTAVNDSTKVMDFSDYEQVGLSGWGTIKSFAQKGDTLFVGSDVGGVFRSFDEGVTWSYCNNGMQQANIYDLMIVSGVVYAGTNNGLYKSSDWGGTWAIENGTNYTAPAQDGTIIKVVDIDTLNSKLMFLDDEGNKLWYRTGTTWASLTITADARTFEQIVTEDDSIFVWGTNGGHTYFYKSVDYAAFSFLDSVASKTIYDIKKTAAHTYYAALLNGNGAYKSTDGLRTFAIDSAGFSSSVTTGTPGAYYSVTSLALVNDSLVAHVPNEGIYVRRADDKWYLKYNTIYEPVWNNAICYAELYELNTDDALLLTSRSAVKFIDNFTYRFEISQNYKANVDIIGGFNSGLNIGSTYKGMVHDNKLIPCWSDDSPNDAQYIYDFATKTWKMIKFSDSKINGTRSGKTRGSAVAHGYLTAILYDDVLSTSGIMRFDHSLNDAVFYDTDSLSTIAGEAPLDICSFGDALYMTTASTKLFWSSTEFTDLDSMGLAWRELSLGVGTTALRLMPDGNKLFVARYYTNNDSAIYQIKRQQGTTTHVVSTLIATDKLMSPTSILQQQDGSLLASVQRGYTVDVSVQKGIYRSTNSGTTWTRVFDPGDENASMSNIVRDPRDPNTLYCAAYVSGNYFKSDNAGIVYSTDGGATWTASTQPRNILRSINWLDISYINGKLALLCATGGNGYIAIYMQ